MSGIVGNMGEQRDNFSQYYCVSRMLRWLYADHKNHSQKICKRQTFLPSVFINIQYMGTYISFVSVFNNQVIAIWTDFCERHIPSL